MATKQFLYTRKFSINSRQDARDEGRFYSKINIGSIIKTGPVFINNGRFNLAGLIGTGPKMSKNSKTFKLRLSKLE